MNTSLSTSEVTVRVGPKVLLDGVTLSIAGGESVALVGPNGAGKSTLLRTLAGEISPSAGTVLVKGKMPRAYKAAELALQRAVLSQHITVTFPFTVLEIVHMGAGERGGASIDRLAEAALEDVGLAGLRDRIFSTLSGGEQQRAHLARTLVQLRIGEKERGPGILLLDEPTASLDLCHQLDLLALVRRCQENGTAIVTILHDLNMAALFASRVVALHQGRIAMDGSPQTAIAEPLLTDVFNVENAVNRTPPAGVPFVLPHQARKLPN